MKKIQGKIIQPGPNVAGNLSFRKPIFVKQDALKTNNTSYELGIFIRAVDKVKELLWERLNQTGERAYHDALLLIEEPTFPNDIKKAIKRNHLTAISAISNTAEKFKQMFEDISDPKIKQKASLVTFLAALLYRELGIATDFTRQNGMDKGSVYLVKELDLYTIESLILSNPLGIITQNDPENFQSFDRLFSNVPIISLKGSEKKFNQFSYDELVEVASAEEEIFFQFDEREELKVEVPAVQKDDKGFYTPGKPNLEVFVKDVTKARKYNYELIVNTNQLFKKTRPTLAEQVIVYQNLISKNPTRKITFTLLNVNSTFKPKWIEEKKYISELMVKGIRLSYLDQNLFEEQIRAILMAAQDAESQVTIAIPFVQSHEEFFVIKDEINRIMDEVKLGDWEVGMVKTSLIVEVPAFAYNIEDIARDSDEVILDLDEFCQYLLGIEKNSKLFSHLFQPLNPVVLRFVAYVNQQIRANGARLIIKGESVNEPEVVLALVGLGIKDLAIDAKIAPKTKKLIRKHDPKKISAVMNKALTFKTANDVLDALTKLQEE